MLFQFPSITAILALTGLVSATPLVQQRQVEATPERYYLQTKVVGSNNSDCGSNKDGLWVFSYHTGAGLGDTGLTTNKSEAWQSYLNGTQLLFNYPDGSAPAPWPFAVEYGQYQGWYLTTISIAGASVSSGDGFFFNSSGLQYNYSSSAGWLACDWWRGSPQLFSLGRYQYGQIPSTCSQVELLPVLV